MTVGDNGTESSPPAFLEIHLGRLKLSPLERLLFLCISVPFILHTVLSNSLVIHAIRKYSSLRNPANMFLLSLAITDLTCGLLVMPVACYYSFLGEWPFGMEECKIWLFITTFLATCSVYHLCVIAVDRYLAIAHPVVYFNQRSVDNSGKIVGVLWATSFVVIFQVFFTPWGYDYPDTFERNTPCTGLEDGPVTAFAFASIVAVPLLTMLVMYYILYRKNKKRQRKKKVNNALSDGSAAASFAKAGEANLRSDLPETENENEKKGEPENVKEVLSGDEETGREETAAATFKQVVEGSKRRVQVSSVGIEALFSYSGPSLQEERICQVCKAVIPLKEEEKKEEEEDRESQSPENEIEIGDATRGQANCPSPNDPCRVMAAAPEQSSRMEILVTRERKYILMTVVIVCIFAVSFIPVFVVYVIMKYLPDAPVSPWITSLVWWLHHVNSASNPIIYTAMNQDFREAFSDTYRRTFRRTTIALIVTEH